jgi:hypothetical protein
MFTVQGQIIGEPPRERGQLVLVCSSAAACFKLLCILYLLYLFCLPCPLHFLHFFYLFCLRNKRSRRPML